VLRQPCSHRASANSTPAATVSILTNDGRHIVGTLTGYDKSTNVVLTDSFERIYSKDAATETVALGLYVLRGDSIGVIGEVDEEKDEGIRYSELKVAPVREIIH
jgi:U6 snRNA-associated Sm-like protein LSm8